MKGLMDMLGIDPSAIAEQAEGLIKLLQALDERVNLVLANQKKIMRALNVEVEEEQGNE
jgi:hypothetical protein